jgi:hypothetical protein
VFLGFVTPRPIGGINLSHIPRSQIQHPLSKFLRASSTGLNNDCKPSPAKLLEMLQTNQIILTFLCLSNPLLKGRNLFRLLMKSILSPDKFLLSYLHCSSAGDRLIRIYDTYEIEKFSMVYR